MSKTSENHARAPLSAKVVQDFRAVFGADQVVHVFVNENGLVVGRPYLEDSDAARAA